MRFTALSPPTRLKHCPSYLILCSRTRVIAHPERGPGKTLRQAVMSTVKAGGKIRKNRVRSGPGDVHPVSA